VLGSPGRPGASRTLADERQQLLATNLVVDFPQPAPSRSGAVRVIFLMHLRSAAPLVRARQLAASGIPVGPLARAAWAVGVGWFVSSEVPRSPKAGPQRWSNMVPRHRPRSLLVGSCWRSGCAALSRARWRPAAQAIPQASLQHSSLLPPSSFSSWGCASLPGTP